MKKLIALLMALMMSAFLLVSCGPDEGPDDDVPPAGGSGDVTPLKRAVKTPKIYFRDTGLACYLTRWLSSETLAYGAMNGHMFETFVVSEILKSFANIGLDYRHFVSYYRGHDKIRQKINGETIISECEIDLIIEENGICYPVEIKQNSNVSATETSAFQVLDKLENKKRGMGAVICNCPQPGMLRENIIQLPVWSI